MHDIKTNTALRISELKIILKNTMEEVELLEQENKILIAQKNSLFIDNMNLIKEFYEHDPVEPRTKIGKRLRELERRLDI